MALQRNKASPLGKLFSFLEDGEKPEAARIYLRPGIYIDFGWEEALLTLEKATWAKPPEWYSPVPDARAIIWTNKRVLLLRPLCLETPPHQKGAC
jgi:hypothetical protein